MEVGSVYRCAVCGNVVEMLHVGGGQLVCCGQPMQLLTEQTADAATEKHVPVIEQTAEGILVKVGSVPHPMTENHYLEWIELTVDGVCHRRFLKPGDPPEALFSVKGNQLQAREYCTIHGLWKS
ncbi:MAG TPA: desulfoferrodoxin [Firmicutes bacterium]|nr:desulfoferrodoxin [Bacillota bacterium]